MAPQIIFRNVSYSYSFENREMTRALSRVSFCVNPGEFVMVIGKTGSGKSTLLQLIDGLLWPLRGLIKVDGLQVSQKMTRRQIKRLRQLAGLVFQIPQDQLFGATVLDDLTFGPRNLGFGHDQTKKIVSKIVRLFHIDSFLSRSPFDLSGGQMKRVAIAGALACQPKILILDEPTAGLDYAGTVRIMKIINDLRLKFNLTVIMVTHEMGIVAKFATRILALDRGRLMADVDPRQLFADQNLLNKAGLDRPFAPRTALALSRMGIKLDHLPLTTSDLADEIIKTYGVRHRRG